MSGAGALHWEVLVTPSRFSIAFFVCLQDSFSTWFRASSSAEEWFSSVMEVAYLCMSFSDSSMAVNRQLKAMTVSSRSIVSLFSNEMDYPIWDLLLLSNHLTDFVNDSRERETMCLNGATIYR